MNLSRIFHCSVINVLCFAVVQQLLYLITDPSACQQLFYFSFLAAVQQLLYLTRSKALCQQLFKIVFCCPLRNISVSRVSLKIISCCDVFVNNFFIFFLLSLKWLSVSQSAQLYQHQSIILSTFFYTILPFSSHKILFSLPFSKCMYLYIIILIIVINIITYILQQTESHIRNTFCCRNIKGYRQ